MTIENNTEATEQTTVSVKDLGSEDLSYPEYVALRRGEKVVSSESAPAPKKESEQKKSPESDAEEKEAKDESEEELETDEESNESEEEKEKPKLNAKASAAERRALEEQQRREALEQRLAQLERGETPKKNPAESKQAVADGKPNPDQFDTHAEYVEALTDWKVEQKDKIREQKLQQEKLESEQAKVQKAYADKEKAFSKKVEDYQEVMESVDDVPLPPALIAAVLESELGPEISYELAKDREHLERVVKMSPIAVAREIGKIEAKILARASEPKKEPKKLTNAPKPIGPVGTSRAAVAKTIDDPNLSFSDYVRLRRDQMKRRGA
jgi:hypothetical protein